MPIFKNKYNNEEKTYHFSFFLLSDSLENLLLHTRAMTPADLITKRKWQYKCAFTFILVIGHVVDKLQTLLGEVFKQTDT